jgi:rhamnosyltransferase
MRQIFRKILNQAVNFFIPNSVQITNVIKPDSKSDGKTLIYGFSTKSLPLRIHHKTLIPVQKIGQLFSTTHISGHFSSGGYAFYAECPDFKEDDEFIVEQSNGGDRPEDWRLVASIQLKELPRTSQFKKTLDKSHKAVLIHCNGLATFVKHEHIFKKLKASVDFYVVISNNGAIQHIRKEFQNHGIAPQKIFINNAGNNFATAFLIGVQKLLKIRHHYKFLYFFNLTEDTEHIISIHDQIIYNDNLRREVESVIAPENLDIFENNSIQMLALRQTIKSFLNQDINTHNFAKDLSTLCNIFSIKPRQSEFANANAYLFRFDWINNYFTSERINQVLALELNTNNMNVAFQRFLGLLATENYCRIAGAPLKAIQFVQRNMIEPDHWLKQRIRRAVEFYFKLGFLCTAKLVYKKIYKLAADKFWHNKLMTGAIYLISKTHGRIYQIYDSSNKQANKRLCIFASNWQSDTVPKYILEYLKNIASAKYDILFVTTARKVTWTSAESILRYCFRIIHRESIGRDFGSWKIGIRHLQEDIRFRYESLLLVNDSVFAPLYRDSLHAALTIRPAKGSVIGLTDSFQNGYHLQSYFLLFDSEILRLPFFWDFWESVKMLPDRYKNEIIQRYEIGLSKKLISHNIKLHPIYSIYDLAKRYAEGLISTIITHINPTDFFRDELVKHMRAPFMKREQLTIRYLPEHDESWYMLLKATDFTPELVEEYIRHEITIPKSQAKGNEKY